MLAFQVAVFVVSLPMFSLLTYGIVSGIFSQFGGMSNLGITIYLLSFFGLVWSLTFFIVGG